MITTSGFQPTGTVVTATLFDTEVKVHLVDTATPCPTRLNEAHRYYGGHARRSPVTLTVLADGNWHVVVDLGGFTGASCDAGGRVLAGVDRANSLAAYRFDGPAFRVGNDISPYRQEELLLLMLMVMARRPPRHLSP